MAAFPYAAHGVHVSDAIAKHFPEEYETWYYVSPKDEYYAYLQVRRVPRSDAGRRLRRALSVECVPLPVRCYAPGLPEQAKWASVPFPPNLKGHDTSPFIWLETASAQSKDQIEIKQLIGPSEKLGEWALQQPRLAGNEEVRAAATSVTGVWTKVTEIFVSPVSTADVSP